MDTFDEPDGSYCWWPWDDAPDENPVDENPIHEGPPDDDDFQSACIDATDVVVGGGDCPMHDIMVSSTVVDRMQENIKQETERLYSKKTIKEAMDPRNVGRMANADCCKEHTGPCGDTMELYLMIEDGRISQALFYTDGCVPTIACGSMLTQMVIGKTISEALSIEGEDLLHALDGLPPENQQP